MTTKKTKNTLSPVTALFENDQVRRVMHDGQLHYAAADIVRALADTAHPDEYLFDLKVREPAMAGGFEQVPFPTADGGTESLDAVTAVEALRLVQSIRTPRAERVRAWMAEAAKQRIEEMENPELAILRTRELYERKGAAESDDYRQLTNELFQHAFGMDVQEYRRYKGLTNRPGENLRDHMTDLELVLTMLGEATATAFLRDRDAQGLDDLTNAAKDAGEVVASAKAEIERHSGKTVANPGNHLRRVA
jgi:hypothetical protein